MAVAGVLASPIPPPTDHPDLDAEADEVEPEDEGLTTDDEPPDADASGADAEVDRSAPEA